VTAAPDQKHDHGAPLPVLRVTVQKCEQQTSKTIWNDGFNHNHVDQPQQEPQQQQQPSLYFEDFSHRTGTDTCCEGSGGGRVGGPVERAEIYKARTLEDINLIYSAQTLVSTRQRMDYLVPIVYGQSFHSRV
jgi:hypothetical protein